MNRAPRQLAAEIAEVKPRTIDAWVRRGLLVRHDDGYDMAELLALVDNRKERHREGTTRGRVSRWLRAS